MPDVELERLTEQVLEELYVVMEDHPDMTEEEYARNAGEQCPLCSCRGVKYCGFQREGFCVFQVCYCSGCEASWEEYYLLAGYIDLQEKKED